MQPVGTMTYVPESGNWRIRTTPDVVIRLKRIFPRAQQWSVGELTIHHTPEVAEELEWVLGRFPMEVSDIRLLKRGARAYRATVKAGEELVNSPTAARQYSLAIPLRDYQSVGTSLYLLLGQLLLADYIGLGKTATAIGSFTEPKMLPALVVAQAHLPKQWKEEINRFLPSARVHIIKQCQHYPLPDADVYITSYSKLSSWTELLSKRIRSVVFDEIQELRLTDSQKYKAAKMLCDVVPHRLGMSATPIANYGGEIWAIYNLLAPDALGTLAEFSKEWCESDNGKLIVRDPDALGHYLRNRRLMLRRTRKEVGRELPPATRCVQEIDFDQRAYQKAVSSAEELAKVILSGTFLEKGQAARKFDTMLRQATGIAKAPFVAELVRMLLESGESVLLGGWHHAVFDIWAERLKEFNPVWFTGLQTPAQKAASKEAFMSGKSKLMMMSLRSGAGTDGLQKVCSCAVIGELDWTSVVHDQFIGRIARDGQEDPCQVFIPIATQGSDPTVASILGLKSSQASGILNLGLDEDMDELEVTPDRVRRLAVDFLKSRGASLPDSPVQHELISA